MFVKYISSNRTLNDLAFSCSYVGDTSFINTMSNLKLIHCFESDIDFNRVSSKHINTIQLISCNIKNLYMLKNCSSLTKLEIYKGSYEGMTRSKGNYVLQDSSVFSELDTILELDIKDVKIEDIKGFLDMESLKKIYVSKESMTKD